MRIHGAENTCRHHLNPHRWIGLRDKRSNAAECALKRVMKHRKKRYIPGAVHTRGNRFVAQQSHCKPTGCRMKRRQQCIRKKFFLWADND